MYIPTAQKVLAVGMAAYGGLDVIGNSPPNPTKDLTQQPPTISESTTQHHLTHSQQISAGHVLDYAVEKCLDEEGNIRCTKPFLVQADKCYSVEWSTKGVVSHTTVEVRDVASGEVVFYRDTNGEWTPEKGELVYLDFKPRVWKTGNDTVEYVVKTCE